MPKNATQMSIADTVLSKLRNVVEWETKPTRLIVIAAQAAVDKMRWFYKSQELEAISDKLKQPIAHGVDVDLAPAYQKLLKDKSDIAAFALLRVAFYDVIPEVSVFFNTLVTEQQLKADILRFAGADSAEDTRAMGIRIVSCVSGSCRKSQIDLHHAAAMADRPIPQYVFAEFNTFRAQMPPGRLQQPEWLQIGSLLITAAEEMSIQEQTDEMTMDVSAVLMCTDFMPLDDLEFWN